MITAIATAVVGGATIYYALQNRKMAIGFKVQNKPLLNLYNNSKLSFTLENIGMISAKNIVLTPRIELKGVSLDVGKFEVEELNSKEKTSIELDEKVLLKLKEKGLVSKRKARDYEAFMDQDTEEIDFKEIEVEDWELSKSHFDFELKFNFTYKSDSKDSYSSNRPFHVELFPISIHPTDNPDNTHERIRFFVSPIQGMWKD